LAQLEVGWEWVRLSVVDFGLQVQVVQAAKAQSQVLVEEQVFVAVNRTVGSKPTLHH
jgi:hypothetical protein